MSVKHFAVALALILIDPRQRRIVQHAVPPPVATLPIFQRRGVTSTALAAAGVDKGGYAINMRRRALEYVKALPRPAMPAPAAGSW